MSPDPISPISHSTKDTFPYVIVDGSDIRRMPPLERPILFMKGDVPARDGK